jgi:hypothetical protein
MSGTMATVYTPCSRTYTLPVSLFDPSKPPAPHVCDIVTNKHKEHRDSAWCSCKEYDVGKDYLMRAVRVYLRAIASAWRDADEEGQAPADARLCLDHLVQEGPVRCASEERDGRRKLHSAPRCMRSVQTSTASRQTSR